MKHSLLVASIVASMSTFAVSAHATDVGVSVNVGQPGFYGQINIGDFPQPQVIYAQPIIVDRRPMDRPPIYLHVPPGHAKHWSKHCRKYNACGERVYFVKDSWYNNEYVPRYQEQHGGGHDDHGGGKGKKGHGKDRDEKHGHGHDH